MISALSDTQRYLRFKPVVDVLARGEHAFWIFTPKSDQLYRIPEFAKYLQENTCRRVVTIHSLQYALEDASDTTKIAQHFSEQPTTIVFSHAEVLTQTGQPFLAKLFELCLAHPQVNCCFVTEQFPYQLTLHELQQNILFYQLYSPDECTHFLSFLEQEYQHTFSPACRKKILALAGGSFWLIKQLTREQLGVTPSQLDLRCEAIWRGFTSQEQQTLLGKDAHPFAQSVLEKLGVLTGNSMTIPLLEKYIQQHIQAQKQLTLREQQVFFGEVNTASFLSKKSHQLLAFCLTHRGQTITREELAKQIWSAEHAEEYSDWTLDQVIHRFRQELRKLGITTIVLQTKKGKGYHVFS